MITSPPMFMSCLFPPIHPMTMYVTHSQLTQRDDEKCKSYESAGGGGGGSKINNQCYCAVYYYIIMNYYILLKSFPCWMF